ncbi:HEAT repeat domain-containing protein [Sporosarcina sp. GW1-11]|uniref:HEAT repeat domain-containing protein n=1 Tax=Sporosarcina sp. GW1-11 TaxID=2899126 RepID=UPI00294E4345|nr:HEAT repeat domain-containing protein [Sporosarcina sp. GW1-11]MDV6378305.1 HEAT repeat domain-containing protein [Sporosarcina sp. GW1-11]
MNRILLLLMLAIVLLFLVLLFLFLLLIFYRLRQVKRKKTIQNYIERYQEKWISYLVDDELSPEQLKPANAVEMEAVDELFFRLRYHFDSEELTKKINDYASEYMESYYLKQLTHRNPSIRINVLYKIYLYDLTFLHDAIIKQLEKKVHSKEEYLVLCKIVAKNFQTDFAPYYINPKIPLGEFDYKRLLVELDKSQIELLAEDFDDLPDLLKFTILDIVGANHYLDWLPLMHHCLDSPIQELRIRALKNIALLEVADAYSVYEKFASSTVWEERLMAAKIFAFSPQEQAEAVLNRLITDSSYAVRLQAAKSMKSLKNGQQALDSVITNSSDAFAVDLAEEMLGKE